MATAGALCHKELMSEGKNLRLQRCASLKGLPSRRKQRENDRHYVAEKLQRRLAKFNQFSQNVVFGRHTARGALSYCGPYSSAAGASILGGQMSCENGRTSSR